MPEIKERPILFSTEMVKAILREDNPKAQTRRVMKPQPVYHSAEKYLEWTDRRGLASGCPLEDAHWWLDCPYGKVGDSLWVRETWGISAKIPMGFQRGLINNGIWLNSDMAYRADSPTGNWCWRPSIHMPRWASRITLEIVSIRVQRIQDITPYDAEAEGVQVSHYYCDEGVAPDFFPSHRCDPIGKFRELWDKINLKRGYGWETNPWCWVLEFKRG